MRHLLWIASALTLLCASPVVVQSAAPDPLRAQGEAIRDRFVAAIRACGVEPSFLPTVEVDTRPSLVSYNTEGRVVRISRWEELDPGMQGLVTAWSQQGTLGLTPEQMFGEIFNSFLLAHELGHYLEHMSGRLNTVDLWQSEVEANQIAIAFWEQDAGQAERLPMRVENFNRFLEGLPDPVPTGEDSRAWFIANYDGRLSTDAAAYGWYQGAFVRTAWAQRADRDFCGWVQANPPLPEEQVES